MKGIAYSSMRVGKRYRAINYGERFDFELQEIISSDEFRLKDLFTLEQYFLSDITRYGRGEDFEIRELG